jgi:hypothetical protein
VNPKGETAQARNARWPALLIAGYLLLLVAWAFGNAPYASPDEAAHYLRAVGISVGELVPERGRFEGETTLTEQQLAWLNRFTGSVTVPDGLAPVITTPCFVVDTTNSAACHPRAGPGGRQEELTYVATYLPLPYLAPALALKPAGDPVTALLLARLASALIFGSFVALAVVLLSDGSQRLALVGLVIALTPMTLFLGASLNPNSLEIAAAVAFVAALLRLTRVEPPPPWVWIAGATAGATLALSRPTGPLWLVMAGGAVVVAFGVRPFWWRVSAVPRVALFAITALVVAVLGTGVWERQMGGEVTASTSDIGVRVEHGLYQVREIVPQMIGVFGYLTVALPYGAYAGWWLLVAGLMALALVVGPRREAIVLAAVAALVLVVPVALYAFVFAESGFNLQGRYFLGLAVVVPLLAGETVFRNRIRLAGAKLARLPAVVAVMAGSAHLVAWYWNARQYAVGSDGPLWFLGVSDWTPVGSWYPWSLAALAGSALVVGSGLGVSLPRRRG